LYALAGSLFHKFLFFTDGLRIVSAPGGCFVTERVCSVVNFSVRPISIHALVMLSDLVVDNAIYLLS